IHNVKCELSLLAKGRLFDFRDWLSQMAPSGKIEPEGWARLLKAAVDPGFHSMVDVLLAGRGWQPYELSSALWRSLTRRRPDLRLMIIQAGARLNHLSVEYACRFMDIEFLKQLLDAGCDPSRDNAFARALGRYRGRPLLGFYRKMRE